MGLRVLLISGCALLALAGPAHAQTNPPTAPNPSPEAAALAAKFGALDTVRDASLSPDGTHMAFVGAVPGGMGLTVVDLNAAGGAPKVLTVIHKQEETLTGCDWVSNTRLICNVFIETRIDGYKDADSLLGTTRLFALDSYGSNLRLVSAELGARDLGWAQDGGDVIDWTAPDRPGSVLITRQYVEQQHLGTNVLDNGDGLGVEAVDTATLRRDIVETPQRFASRYIADGHGNVRVVGRVPPVSQNYSGRTEHFLYRQRGSRIWHDLSHADLADQTHRGFVPAAVDSTRNVVYGFDDKDGYRVLASISLDDAQTKTVVVDHPGADIDGLMTLGRNRTVVGASYVAEKRIAEYFDPELDRLHRALAKALPGDPAVNFIDMSEDGNKLLIQTGGDTNPGILYILDKPTHHLSEVLPVREELDGQPLATMTPITYQAADGTAIPGYLTLPPGSDGKNLAAIVMPHGGPSARDEWGFDWLVQFYAARGFAVLQPNFRGSAGYGAAWFQKNGFQSWRTAIGDVNDAGRWLVKQGIAAPGKLAIVGWSYGGYAALQSAVLDPGLYKAIVAIAPVTDLDALRKEHENYTDYNLVNTFIGAGPHVAEGSPARHADAFRAPVLLFAGDRDQNVSADESRLMTAQLTAAHKPVQYIEFPGLNHDLDNAAARTRLLGTSDAFLRAALGLQP